MPSTRKRVYASNKIEKNPPHFLKRRAIEEKTKSTSVSKVNKQRPRNSSQGEIEQDTATTSRTVVSHSDNSPELDKEELVSKRSGKKQNAKAKKGQKETVQQSNEFEQQKDNVVEVNFAEGDRMLTMHVVKGDESYASSDEEEDDDKSEIVDEEISFRSRSRSRSQSKGHTSDLQTETTGDSSQTEESVRIQKLNMRQGPALNNLKQKRLSFPRNSN